MGKYKLDTVEKPPVTAPFEVMMPDFTHVRVLRNEDRSVSEFTSTDGLHRTFTIRLGKDGKVEGMEGLADASKASMLAGSLQATLRKLGEGAIVLSQKRLIEEENVRKQRQAHFAGKKAE